MEVLILIGALLTAAIPASIASSKGRGFFLWYIYGLFLFPFALIHAIVIKPNELAEGMAKCPSCASVISKEAKVCPACRTKLDGSAIESTNNQKLTYSGERSLSSSSYQLFLTRTYGIERNATLEKYVIENDVFNTLEDSLREADSRYAKKLKQSFEAEETERRRSEQTDRERSEHLERNAIAAQIEAKKQGRVVIAFGLFVVIFAVGVLIYENKWFGS